MIYIWPSPVHLPPSGHVMLLELENLKWSSPIMEWLRTTRAQTNQQRAILNKSLRTIWIFIPIFPLLSSSLCFHFEVPSTSVQITISAKYPSHGEFTVEITLSTANTRQKWRRCSTNKTFRLQSLVLGIRD